jgi:hypothetical protein
MRIRRGARLASAGGRLMLVWAELLLALTLGLTWSTKVLFVEDDETLP